MSINDLCKDCDGYKDDCSQYYVVKAYSGYCESKRLLREREEKLSFYHKEYLKEPKTL